MIIEITKADAILYGKLGGLLLLGMVGITIFDIATGCVELDADQVFTWGQKFWQFIGLMTTLGSFAKLGIIWKREIDD